MTGIFRLAGRIRPVIGAGALLLALSGCDSNEGDRTSAPGNGALEMAAEPTTDPSAETETLTGSAGNPPSPAEEPEVPAAEPLAAVEPQPAEISGPDGSDPVVDPMPPEAPADVASTEVAETPVIEGSPPPQATAEPAASPAPGAPADGPPPLVTEDASLAPEMLALIEAGDVVEGRTYATRCTACHALDPGGLAPAAAQIGPSLYGIFGARIGAVPGFDYSPVFQALYEANVAWTAARLDTFLADPTAVAPGTAMDVGAIADPVDRANVIAFIRSLAISPLPIEGGEATAVIEGDPELLAMIAEADIDRGRSLVARCSGCHRFGAEETGLIGPNLYNIVGAAIGAEEGYLYSPALRSLNEDGEIWTYDRLDAFLEAPAAAVPGTRMGFGGVDDIRDRAAIIAYLRTLAAEPFPLQVDGGDDEIGVARDGLQPVTFTADQVADGELGYDQHCAACHAESLRGEVDMRLAEGGIGVAPALIGPNFEHRWFARPVGVLFDHIARREPNDTPGTLTTETYADVLAYILERNGFRPGDTRLSADTEILNNLGFFQE